MSAYVASRREASGVLVTYKQGECWRGRWMAARTLEVVWEAAWVDGVQRKEVGSHRSQEGKGERVREGGEDGWVWKPYQHGPIVSV